MYEYTVSVYKWQHGGTCHITTNYIAKLMVYAVYVIDANLLTILKNATEKYKEISPW